MIAVLQFNFFRTILTNILEKYDTVNTQFSTVTFYFENCGSAFEVWVFVFKYSSRTDAGTKQNTLHFYAYIANILHNILFYY